MSISPDTIINTVCTATRLDRTTLFQRHGKRHIGESRMMTFVLLHICCRLDTRDIAALANTEYGAVLYGTRKFKCLYDIDKKTRTTFHNILNTLAA